MMFNFRNGTERADKIILFGSTLVLVSLIVVEMLIAFTPNIVTYIHSKATIAGYIYVSASIFCLLMLLVLLFAKPISPARWILLIADSAAIVFYFLSLHFLPSKLIAFNLIGICVLSAGILLSLKFLISYDRD